MARKELDFYETPKPSVRPLMREVVQYLDGLDPTILDPGCGRGRLLKEAYSWTGSEYLTGIELDPERAATARDRLSACILDTDFLSWNPELVGRGFDFIVCNPPFSLAQEFTDTILRRWHGPSTISAVLLRLSFLASQKRYEWWRSLPSPKLRVLSYRPSFTGGGTDMTDYCWMLWGLPEHAPALAWYGES